MALFIITLFLVLPIFNHTVAQHRMKQARFDTWDTFKNSNTDWKVKWNDKTGGATVIRGTTGRLYNGNPEQAARSFLRDNRTLFGMSASLSELKYKKTIEQNGRKSVKFSQYYESLPVFTGGFSVIIEENSKIKIANGHYFGDINLLTDPSLTSDEAVNQLLTVENLPYPNYANPGIELVVYPLDEKYKLAWKIILEYSFETKYCGFIDTETGSELDFYDMIARSSTGSANVFEIDPSSGNFVPVTLYRMLTGTNQLKGDYVDVVFTEEGSRAQDVARRFEYSPINYHFKEANAYWHIDRIANDYFYSVFGYDMPQIPVYIRGTGGTSPQTPFPHINLGLADTTSPGLVHYRAVVRKDDQIYHEYTHQVCWDIGHEYSGTEVQSKAEGYADYFACSFTDDEIFGEWVAYDVNFMRTCDNDPAIFNYTNFGSINYNNDYNHPIHKNGMIWSGALWEIRKEFGQEIADWIIFKGLLNVNDYSDFEEALEGILQADLTWYSGQHIQTIKDIFCNRGICADLAAPTNFSVTGNIGNHPFAEWDSNTEPDIYGYKLYRSIDSGPYLLLTTLIGKYNTSYTDQGLTITGGKFDPLTCYKVTALDTHLNESEMTGDECVKSNASNKEGSETNFNEKKSYFANVYPNPFNPTTKIVFNVPEKPSVRLIVYNLKGGKVTELMNGNYSSGNFIYPFNGNQFAAGIYFVRFEAFSLETDKSFKQTIKIALIK